jgi:hypothetical protein
MSNLLFMIPKIFLFLEMSKLTPTSFEMSKLDPTAFKMSKLATTSRDVKNGYSRSRILLFRDTCQNYPEAEHLLRRRLPQKRCLVLRYQDSSNNFLRRRISFSGLHKNKAFLGRRRGFSQGRVCLIGFRVLRNHHPPVAKDPASRFGFSIGMTEISTNVFFRQIMMGH